MGDNLQFSVIFPRPFCLLFQFVNLAGINVYFSVNNGIGKLMGFLNMALPLINNLSIYSPAYRN